VKAVLAVDDDLVTGRLLKAEFSSFGYGVTAVKNGRQALEEAAQTPFDAVILDLGLPDMNGLEVLESLKKSRPLLPVIVVTGRTEISSVVEAIRLGAENYLVKPYASNQLVLALKRAVEKAELQASFERQRLESEAWRADYVRALEASNRELQEFVFVASHDLQEPLRKLQSFGKLLADEYGGALGAAGLSHVERMRSAAKRMRRLIDDLLDLTRVTASAGLFLPVDLSEVLAGVQVDLELQLQESQGTIKAAPLPTLDADATQMRQLFQNLLGNALKYRRPDVAPVVKVGWRPLGEPGAAAEGCEISVEDNGIGFEGQYAERIFAPFERLHSKGKFEGTGIGLAICKKVVERHSGSIAASSEPGKGSLFKVTLPMKQQKKGD